MDDLDLMLEMQEAELRVLDIPTYESKHGGPGVHSTGSPQAVHSTAIAGRGRGGRFISKRAAEAFESGARPDAMGRPVRPGSASGKAQGKGPQATPGEIASALSSWDAISGDKRALAQRLDGWTHSRRRTAEALRDSRASGETDFKGGADRLAGELFERIEGNRASNNYTADQIRKAQLTANTPTTSERLRLSDAWSTNRDGRSYLETEDGYRAFVEPDEDAEDRWFVDLVDADGNSVLAETAGSSGEGRRAVDRALADARRPKPRRKRKRTPAPAPAPDTRRDDDDLTEFAERGVAQFNASLREMEYEGLVPPGYDAHSLVRMRAESIRRDLREYPDDRYVTIKVPSGTEVQMLASLARHLLSLKGVAFTYDLETKVWREADHPRDPRTGRFIDAGGAIGAGIGSLTRWRSKRREKGDDWDAPMPAGKYATPGDPRNDPEYEAHVDKIDNVIADYLQTKGDTFTQNSMVVPGEFDDQGRPVRVLTPERQRVHDEIVEGVLAQARSENIPKTGKMVVMGGLPGAGKSTAIKKQGAKFGLELNEDGDPVNAVVINPDDAKEFLLQTPGLVERVPGLTDGEHAAIIHEESSLLASQLATAVIEEGYDVVVDVTLGNGPKTKRKYMDPAREAGYTDFTGVFVDVPLEVSLHSAGMRHKAFDPNDTERFQRTYQGRYVPYKYMINDGAPPEGSDRMSMNRVQYDDLVEAGEFQTALRYDRMTGEFLLDAGDIEV